MRRVISWVLAAALVVIGAVLVIRGLTPSMEQNVPLPSVTDNSQSDADLRSDVGPVDVENTDQGTDSRAWDDPDYAEPVSSMSVTDMAPMSVFVPEAGIYSMTRASDQFVPSRYSNFYSLAIPDNPHRSVWYSKGAAMVGGDEGTTLIASHISHGRTSRGAFWNLHSLTPGAVVWTKDANGDTQEWKVTRVWYAYHTQFPEDYFSATGTRRLVLVTCGGELNSQGYYRENVFVVAEPVT